MPQRVEGNIEIEAPVETVYSYWETLENLPQFMANVEEVTPTGPDTTRWRVKGPFGKTLEWEAQTTQKEHNSAIAWNSTQGEVETSGQVRFVEAGQPGRTRVEVQMNYSDPPGGKIGEVASRAIANPKLQLEHDLRNLKDILEGEATPEEIQRLCSGMVSRYARSSASLRQTFDRCSEIHPFPTDTLLLRSEERRVGKECRSRW